MQNASVLLALFFATGCLTDNPAPRHPAPEPEPAPAAPPVAAAPVVATSCPSGTRAAADGLIDDLEDADGQLALLAGRNGYWWVAKADHAVVSAPVGDVRPVDGGAAGTKKAIRFAGKTDAADQWGATVGVGFLGSGFYDAAKYVGVGFKIKSTTPGANVRFKVPDVSTHPDGGVCKSGCWNSFGKELLVGPDWQEVSVTWTELTQQPDWGDPRPPAVTPSKVKNVEWAVSQGVDFDLLIDDVHFLECQ